MGSQADQKSETKKTSFEAAFEQLQMTVRKLESGELSLEQSLQFFEEGVRLTRLCQEHLSLAEQRVEVLMKTPSTSTSPGDLPGELQPFNTQKS